MWCKVAVECHWWRPSSTISVGHSPTSPTCMCTTLKRNKLHTCQFHCEAFGYFQEYFPLINLSPGTTRQLVCKLTPGPNCYLDAEQTDDTRDETWTCLHVDKRYYRYCWELSWSKCISPCADLCFMFVITNGLASLSQKGSVCRSNIWVQSQLQTKYI